MNIKRPKNMQYKRLIQSCFLALTLFSATDLLISTTGCTTSQQTVTYTTLSSIGATVDAAEKSYLDLVVRGTIPSTSLAQESKLYGDFQSAFLVAVTASQGATNIAAPQTVLDLGNSLVAFIAQLQLKK